MTHPADTTLALYAAGDLPAWQRMKTGIHVNRCESCRELVGAFRGDRDSLRDSAGGLPEDIDWDGLSAEMTANIHVGLAAGECVSPREVKQSPWNWRPVAIAGAFMVVLTVAWMLNIPREDNAALGRIWQAVVRGGRDAMMAGDRGPMVEASPQGIQFIENGSGLGVALTGALPVTTSVSVQGSASAHYVDDDTGQVTITTVYVQ